MDKDVKAVIVRLLRDGAAALERGALDTPRGIDDFARAAYAMMRRDAPPEVAHGFAMGYHAFAGVDIADIDAEGSD